MYTQAKRGIRQYNIYQNLSDALSVRIMGIISKDANQIKRVFAQNVQVMNMMTKVARNRKMNIFANIVKETIRYGVEHAKNSFRNKVFVNIRSNTMFPFSKHVLPFLDPETQVMLMLRRQKQLTVVARHCYHSIVKRTWKMN